MTPGLRTHKKSSLRIAIPDLPEGYERVREIVSLESGDQRKGEATTLMWDVCREADEALIVLMVQPRAFAKGMPDDNLIGFYQKFGFIVAHAPDPSPLLMCRQPDTRRFLQ